MIAFSLSLMFQTFKQEVAVAQEDYTDLIVSLTEQGKLEEALVAVEEYINRDNTRGTYSWWGYNAKGIIFELMGESTKAIYAYQEALQYASQDEKINTLVNIGTLQNDLGDYTEAISHYEEAIHRLDRNNPRRYLIKMFLAWPRFYLSQGDTAILKQVYLEASPKLHKIERHIDPPDKGKAYMQASVIAFQLGRFHEAIQLTKTFLNIRNTDSTKLHLAITLLYSNEEVEANEVFRRVDLRNVSKVSLASWHWLKGDERRARRNLEEHFAEEYSSDKLRERVRRSIRTDEILPYDMWKEARKQKWFRELVYPNTIDYSTEKYAEQPEKETQEGLETYTNENQEKDSTTTVFATNLSNVFHKPDCSKLDASEGLIKFDSPQQASEAGCLPCNYCNPS
jgi:tetratricopeptide (TPR) repeat protein